MDKYNSIKRMFKGKGVGTVSAIIFVALTILMLILILVTKPKHIPTNDINDDSSIGDIVTVRLVQLDEYFAEDGINNYCLGLGEDGYVYIVKAKRLGFYERFYELLEYDPESGAPAPLANVVAGAIAIADDDVLQFGSEVYEIGFDEFVDWTGAYIIDTTVSQVSGGVGNELFKVLAIVFAIFSIQFIIIALIPKIRLNKTLKTFAENGQIDHIYDELGSPANLGFSNGKVIFTEHYLVSLVANTILRYEDVRWFYKSITRINYISAVQSLVAHDAFNHKNIVAKGNPGKNMTAELDAIAKEIALRCPHVLIGHTRENKKAYKHGISVSSHM